MGTLTSGLKCGSRKWFDFFITIRIFLRFCIKNIVVDKKTACYNKLMFSCINLVEYWGSGIPRIIKKVKAAGLQEVEVNINLLQLGEESKK